MLTLTELIKNIENAKSSSIKAKIQGRFYQGVLEQASDYNRSEGEITINFDGREETELAFELLPVIFESDYDFKRYVVEVDGNYKEDYEMIISFDLNKPLKELIKPEKENFAPDDIPF